MDSSPHPSSSEDAELQKISIRIYVLSVFLCRFQWGALRNKDTPGSSDTVGSTGASSLGKALNRIAILLTRGTDEEKARTIAVTAGPLTSAGIHARIVRASIPPSSGNATHFSPSTSQTRPSDFSSEDHEVSLNTHSSSSKTTTTSSSDLHDIPSPAPSDSVATTQLDEDPTIHPTRNSKHLQAQDEDIHLQGRVDRSPSKFASTEEDSVAFHPASSYNFHGFARLFFLVLRSAGQNGCPTAAMHFAISQCAAEISERCAIVRKKYTWSELKEWLPTNDETVQPTAIDVDIEGAQIFFSGSGLEGRISTTADNLTTFAFDKGNVHLWLRALINLVDRFQQSLLNVHDSHSPNNVRRATALSAFVHLFLTLIPVRLWTIPSLDTVLRSLRERRRAATSSLIASNGLDELLVEEDVMNEDDEAWVVEERVASGGNKKKRAEELKGSLPDCLAFSRAVDGLTVWTTSARALATSRFAKTDLPLQYVILDLPRCELDKQDVPMQDALKYWVKRFPQLASLKKTLQKLLKTTHSLSGTCHCEAGIMADDAAQSMQTHDINTRTSQAPSSDGDDEDEDDLDEAQCVPIELGVNKKTCPFCWMLANALNMKQNITFLLPGAHDYYYPWIPPASLSKEVLLEVERQGEERLRDMLNRDRGVIPGNITSPTSSDDDFSDQESVAKELVSQIREPDGTFIL